MKSAFIILKELHESLKYSCKKMNEEIDKLQEMADTNPDLCSIVRELDEAFAELDQYLGSEENK